MNNLRIGDWVVHEDRIAIVTAIEPPGAVIHHVGPDGATIEQQGGGHRWDVPVPLAALRPATDDEIPESRRYPGREEEERRSAALLAAAPPPVPGDTAPPSA